MPVVLYGCETWSLTLREERRLRVFDKRVLRRIFRPKRDEVTGEWRKLHNEELHGLYSFTQYCADDKIEKNEMGGACSAVGGKGGRCLGLTTLPPSCADCFKIWEPQLPGTLWACQGL
jgi:hypothetical protein